MWSASERIEERIDVRLKTVIASAASCETEVPVRDVGCVGIWNQENYDGASLLSFYAIIVFLVDGHTFMAGLGILHSLSGI